MTMTWAHNIWFRAKQTYVIMLIAILIQRRQQTGSNSFLQDFYAFTELKKPPFSSSIKVMSNMTVATNDLEFVCIATVEPTVERPPSPATIPLIWPYFVWRTVFSVCTIPDQRPSLWRDQRPGQMEFSPSLTTTSRIPERLWNECPIEGSTFYI